MSDYEVYEIKRIKRTPHSIPGASQQLAQDIRAANAAGLSYGVYIWRKHERAEEEYFKKYGRRRLKSD